jgi:hypothetical protein
MISRYYRYFLLLIIILLLIKLIMYNNTCKIYPIVVLLDLDKTLIGDVSPQVEEYSIINNINVELQTLGQKKIPYNKKKLENELRNGIIRPYLQKFINLLKTYENVEVFIYTASDDKWAKTIIPVIEKILNYKFNKPLLTRNNIIVKNNQLRKSIKVIKPLIFKSLKNKYNMDDVDNLKYIMLFDDTKNVLLENSKQIKVKPYNYMNQTDYLSNMNKNVIRRFYPVIEHILNLKHSPDINGFYSRYYNFLRIRYLYVENNNKKYVNDNVWNIYYKAFKHNITNISYVKLLNLLKSI